MPDPRSSSRQRDRRPGRLDRPWTRAVRSGALAGCLLLAGFGPAVGSAHATATGMVDLGQSSAYAVLSGASVGNTVSAPGDPYTTLHGSLGVKVSTQPTGFPPGIVTGSIDVGNAAAVQAHADAVAAYTAIAGRTGGAALAGALAGATIQPGLYTVTGAVSNTGTVTLDGANNPNAVFVFQVGGALTTAALSHVTLINGAQASRVFWQVNGAAALGAGSTFAGTLIALDAVGVGNGTVVNGRAFARNGALTLDDDQVYSAPPVVTIAGGASATTTDTTPTISGTTDVGAPATVSVTVNGTPYTATPSAGAWSVTSTILANATYPVVATVTDGAGNTTTATQALTVDTVPPIVTLDDGPTVTTNDRTPTIAGSSDVAPGTIVRVALDAQTLNAVVQTGGTWNVTPAALSDGTRTVTASVTDPAGNPGAASQSLTVDTVAPAVTIAGGGSALTNDATPAIAGAADVAPGTTITVDLADETLLGVVNGDGAWSVTAAALADGPHRVVVSVSDAAGNPATTTQTLTVDTVSPAVAIAGGSTATTNDLDPTIVGTSDAAPGTTVTVVVADQTMTTLLQGNGTWNVTPTRLALGTWVVVASVRDPAGNVGSAQQTLTIAVDPASSPGGTGSAGPSPGATGSTAPTGTTGTPGATLTPIPADPPSTTPAPAPVPPPAGPGPFDAVAATAVARNGSQRLRGDSLSISTKVTAPSGGRVAVTTTGTVKIKGVRKAIALGRLVASIAAGRSTTLKLALAGSKKTTSAALKRIKSAIATRKVVIATITLRIVDDAGHTRTVGRTVTLI